MNWQPTADGHHCTRHDYAFKRGEVCQRCVTDPGDPPSAEKSSEEQDRELAAQAAEYQSRARKLWREVVELVDGTDRDVNAAAKLSAESAKWERLAMDTRDRLAQRKHLREALEKRASMSGKRGNN